MVKGKNLTKLEICNRIAEKIGDTSLNKVKPIVDLIFEEILIGLSESKKIEIRGFGSFKIKEKKAKIGRNPRTGVEVQIPARTLPCFKFSKEAYNNFNTKYLKK